MLSGFFLGGLDEILGKQRSDLQPTISFGDGREKNFEQVYSSFLGTLAENAKCKKVLLSSTICSSVKKSVSICVPICVLFSQKVGFTLQVDLISESQTLAWFFYF